MKRLAGTVLGLLFAQVCCELGLPHRGSEGMRRCSIVGRGRGDDKSCPGAGTIVCVGEH